MIFVGFSEITKEIVDISATIPQTGKQRERAGKEEALTRSLGAHVEMCCAIGNPNRALTSLLYYRSRATRTNSPVVKSINIYNTLLRGFASVGNINKVFIFRV